MMWMKKQKQSVVVPSMIGALTALAVGGIMIMSVMYCAPLREKMMCMKKEAKHAFKVVKDEAKKV